MTPRPFGTTGSLVSPIAFGAMRITADADGTSSVLLHALERGITAIDTARNYGDSEAIVGRTLRAWQGPRPWISTKVKPLDISNWRFYVPMAHQFTPASIVESVETSLRTLGVDCVDFVQLHQWYYRWGRETGWLETLHRLREHELAFTHRSTPRRGPRSRCVRVNRCSNRDQEHMALFVACSAT